MRLKIQKELIVDLLSNATSSVERRHTLNILSNAKISINEKSIEIVGSDLEVQLIAEAPLNKGECIEPGSITVPAKKLLELCKALPNQALISIETTDDQRCHIKCKQSKFVLGTLPAEDFPILNSRDNRNSSTPTKVEIESTDLKKLFDKTAFSMAVQDVRFYLTGTLLEIDQNTLKAVTTDGHRMAICEASIKCDEFEKKHIILPKKAVSEIQRLLGHSSQLVNFDATNEFFEINQNCKTKDGVEYTIKLTTKLIDGKYPDYKRVIPTDNNYVAIISHHEFKQALSRVAILSNEKLRGVICTFTEGTIELRASNPEQDEALEDFAIDYNHEDLEISFNSQYLSDILNVIQNSDISLHMAGDLRSVLIKNPADHSHQYVVMPMRI